MITSAKWQLGKRVLNILLVSGEQRSCGLERNNDPASIGDGPSRELVKAFLSTGGTISEPDVPSPAQIANHLARARLRELGDKSAYWLLLLQNGTAAEKAQATGALTAIKAQVDVELPRVIGVYP